MKNCPFCGGKVKKHPQAQYQIDYVVCYHSIDCFLNDASSPPFNFTLIPKGRIAKQWQKRKGEEE